MNVLFLCTGNSARSILAEAYLNAAGKGRFVAYSAGSHPAGKVNPLALELLELKGMPTARLRSKSWDEFAASNAPKLDVVLTVCDAASNETCPVWPGAPLCAQWGVADPASVSGSPEERRRAFSRAFAELSSRIDLLLALPLERFDRRALHRELERIGRHRDASSAAQNQS